MMWTVRKFSSSTLAAVLKMTAIQRDYDGCIEALNNLQSNAQYIKEQGGPNHMFSPTNNLKQVAKYLNRLEITLDKLDELSVIHVTGTKGKGTTCAFTESILRKQGFRTGFFSSPHLIEVRERIRIDGQPVGKGEFTECFWKVYNTLNEKKRLNSVLLPFCCEKIQWGTCMISEQMHKKIQNSIKIFPAIGFYPEILYTPKKIQRITKIREQGFPSTLDDAVGETDDYDMPLYFRFLTIMAFKFFLDKKVDVAIVEVGIGGEYDCTNVLRKVHVVGITSLGIDHTSLLGNTIESIAWNKGGIIKEGCKAFSVPQEDNAMKVLKNRAVEKKCESFEVVQNSVNYKLNGPPDIVGLNANLAVALSEAWISKRCNNNKVLSPISPEVIEAAINKVNWPGRFQIKQLKNIRYYLDGAHTTESISICCNWFMDNTRSKSSHKKVLIFNVTGGRSAETFFRELQKCDFDIVLFVTNNASKKCNTYDNISSEDFLNKGVQHKQLWLQVEDDRESKGPIYKSKLIKSYPTIMEAIDFLTKQEASKTHEVLVTGSLHLIGAMLSIIEPALNDS